MFSSKEKKEIEHTTNISNIVGKGTVIEGKIHTEGNLRIEGKFIGKIETKSKLVASESSELEGEIKAQNAEIGGKIKGNVIVDEILVLKYSACIEGDIFTKKLIIEAGAVFNGVCRMKNEITNREFEVLNSEPELIKQ